jgi:hypothetical protein
MVSGVYIEEISHLDDSEILHCLWSPKVSFHFYKNLPLGLLPSHKNPVHNFTGYFSVIHLILVLTFCFRLCLPRSVFFCSFQIRMLHIGLADLPHTCRMSSPSHLFTYHILKF